ncbi:MAG: hypothetical protein DRI34_06495 [Deltaproteobacteria bacterium]|nr:MAG: hypothetical protein DRI34_06495 [Deltaproteobacteria bacterium]
MITADRKPIDEVLASLADARRILLLGCHGCVTVCAAGGEREVAELASELRLADRLQGRQRDYQQVTIERQCDREFFDTIHEQMQDSDLVLSLACGAGVQLAAEVALPVPVVPALNTTFLGVNTGPGSWDERCLGCGDCLLEITGGICPIARCSKSLLNGPCGGSANGKCEIDDSIDCAWQLIHDRLKAQGRLEQIARVIPPRDWSSSRHGGPRRRVRPDLVR